MDVAAGETDPGSRVCIADITENDNQMFDLEYQSVSLFFTFKHWYHIANLQPSFDPAVSWFEARLLSQRMTTKMFNAKKQLHSIIVHISTHKYHIANLQGGNISEQIIFKSNEFDNARA